MKSQTETLKISSSTTCTLHIQQVLRPGLKENICPRLPHNQTVILSTHVMLIIHIMLLARYVLCVVCTKL